MSTLLPIGIDAVTGEEKVFKTGDIIETGSSLDLEVNGVQNTNQTLLNLVQGTNMTITDDGFGNITFNGSASLTFSNSLQNIAGTVNLVNDSTSPGNSYYYGTDSGGTKGFFALPGLSKLVATGTVDGVNADFTFTTAPSVLFVDGVAKQQTSSDSTVNWTIVGLTVTLTVAPNFDIFGI